MTDKTEDQAFAAAYDKEPDVRDDRRWFGLGYAAALATRAPAVEGEPVPWRENVEYLLNTVPRGYLVRVREGGGPESLLDSFITTFIKMREALPLAVPAGEAQGVTWEQLVRKHITDPAVRDRILSVPTDATPEEARAILHAPYPEAQGLPVAWQERQQKTPWQWTEWYDPGKTPSAGDVDGPGADGHRRGDV